MRWQRRSLDRERQTVPEGWRRRGGGGARDGDGGEEEEREW
jgi:hypothetical protein